MTENQVVRTEPQVHLGSALDKNKARMGHGGQKNPIMSHQGHTEAPLLRRTSILWNPTSSRHIQLLARGIQWAKEKQGCKTAKKPQCGKSEHSSSPCSSCEQLRRDRRCVPGSWAHPAPRLSSRESAQSDTDTSQLWKRGLQTLKQLEKPHLIQG